MQNSPKYCDLGSAEARPHHRQHGSPPTKTCLERKRAQGEREWEGSAKTGSTVCETCCVQEFHRQSTHQQGGPVPKEPANLAQSCQSGPAVRREVQQMERHTLQNQRLKPFPCCQHQNATQLKKRPLPWLEREAKVQADLKRKCLDKAKQRSCTQKLKEISERNAKQLLPGVCLSESGRRASTFQNHPE